MKRTLKTPIKMGDVPTIGSGRQGPKAGRGAPRNGQPCAGPGGRYLASAPEADVMIDQLRHLAAHNLRGCPRGCADCARLKQVKNLLLLPFMSDTPQWIEQPAKLSIGN